MAYYLNETREALRSRERRMRDGASVRRSPCGQLEDDRAEPAPAAPGQPETRQTLRRHVGPKGKRRLDGEKLLAVGYWVPTCGES